jgi:hypothetical protein
MRYEPEWISFSEARQRLMSRGLTQHEAETDIALAYRDRKINHRAATEKITTLSGANISPHFLRRLAFKNELKLRLAIPHDLGPADLDWENSRPKKPARMGTCGTSSWRTLPSWSSRPRTSRGSYTGVWMILLKTRRVARSCRSVPPAARGPCVN